MRCAWGDQAPDQIPLTASYKQILKAPLTFPFKKEEKFELPIDSNTLFFFSRGVYSGGQVKVTRSDKHGDVAKVKIRLEYLRPGGPKIAKVCQFTRGDGENGIGIFVRRLLSFPCVNSTFSGRHPTRRDTQAITTCGSTLQSSFQKPPTATLCTSRTLRRTCPTLLKCSAKLEKPSSLTTSR